MEIESYNIDEVRRELAPSGTVRCALNHGNVVLVRRGPTDDQPTGVSVELAKELARHLGLPILFRHYDKAGAVSETAASGDWDICFLAIDPKRAEQIAYSDPYVQIEGAFLVHKESPAETPDDIERLQPKIGVVTGSAYELHLSRTGRGGLVIRFDSPGAAIVALEAGGLDGLAGVRQAMKKVVVDHHDFKVMENAFMTIPQAMGVSVSKPLAARYIKAFIREMKRSGFVRKTLVESGHADVIVPMA